MRARRKLRWFLFVCALYLALSVVGGINLADGALHPQRRVLTDAEVAAFRQTSGIVESQLEDVSVMASDGVLLRGWMLHPPHPNGDGVLLLHGLGDNRLGMTGYAQLMLAHGYTVLMPDARAHGASGGPLATYGLLERSDIHQWLNQLAERIHPRCMYGLGESMGAAQLLQSLDTAPPLCAVIAESAFSDFREIAYDRMGQPFHAGPWVGRTILRPVVEIAFLRARWKYHVDMQEISPEQSAGRSHVPVLLIHGQIDSNIPVRHSRRIHGINLKTVLWEVPGADHCGGIAVAPEEFRERVLHFLSAM